MRHALPVITEDTATLKQRLQRERESRKNSRLQRLSLLASGQAQTRRDVAQLLGVHRHTIGHWLARYATGGLETLLDLYVPPGKPLSLPPHILAALAQALRQPAGFASYEALRQWVQQTYHLDVNYHTLYTIVRTKLKGKLKVPRPSHTKKTLRRSRRSKRPVATSSSVSSRPCIRARCGSAARTRVALADSRCAAGASRPAGCSPWERSSLSLSGSTSMGLSRL